MPLITQEEAFSQYLINGTNSSHFVWFLSEMTFFKTTNGWIFGYRQVGKVTLFALEPLGFISPKDRAGFQDAWREVREFCNPQITLFVSIYKPYMSLLKSEDFQILKVGKEPYVTLRDCMPTGNRGKGVRAGRNQALRAGIRVEEWTMEKILADSNILESMKKLLRLWKDRNIIDMGSFLNKVDPFVYTNHRRYFLAFSKEGKLEAFLVATPIPGKNSFFLEDMIVGPTLSRGVGELLMLQTMMSLSESNFDKASLGVVSTLMMDKDSAYGVPPAIEFFMIRVLKRLSSLYNVAGMETFRKRFKPSFWEDIYVALKNEKISGVSDSFAWFYAIFMLLRCFNPRLNITFNWLKNGLTRCARRHPISWLFLFLSATVFCIVNRGGTLSPDILDRYGFVAAAPFSQWIYRSIMSDFLYLNFWHFLPIVLILVGLFRWAERSHRKDFIFAYAAFLSIFGHTIDYIVTIKLQEYFHPQLVGKLMTYPEIGGSIWLASLLGLQICQFRKNREFYFTILSMGIIIYLVLQSAHFSNLILELDHFLFFSLGYLIGRLKLEWERKQSRKVCKLRPPEADRVVLCSRKEGIAAKQEPNTGRT